MHRPLSPREHVVIVGGGFSGTLFAVNLMRHGGPHATLIERREGQVARGVAYSAADPGHLLNVRAANMSAFPDDPGHFVRWLEKQGLGDAHAFVPRTTYGAYLRVLLNEAKARAGDRLSVIAGDVCRIETRGAGVALTLSDGTGIDADRAVLAVGNLPPHTPPGIDPALLGADLYCPDPWAANLAEGLGEGDRVCLVGTGLTAIDAALLLDAHGFGGTIVALSRRGLRPRRHVDGATPVRPLGEKPAQTLTGLLRSVRRASGSSGWRAAVDALRPVTQMLWGGADDTTRARFLRHLRPFWDVHRHRLAPSVADRIDALVAQGRLRFVAGKTLAAQPDGRGGAILTYRARKADGVTTLPVRRIVNCTGPQGDLLRSDDPLLRSLLAGGSIRPDALRLGLDVDASSRVIRADGTADERLFAVGPMTRGHLWETVAVPDLRVQTWALARYLSNAHWVGGEGL